MESYSSSPDPLQNSPIFQSTIYQSTPKPHARRPSKVRHSFPLQGSSPTKQTFDLDIGSAILPQKIRVTVEAGSDTESTYTHTVDTRRQSGSPSKRPVARRRERTKTTTVPLRGLSDTEDDSTAVGTTPKRGRGRPRKSIGGTPIPAKGTPIPAKKRSRASTPTQKAQGKRRPIGGLSDGDNDEDDNFRLGQGVEISRGKGRSRSRSAKGISRKSLHDAQDVPSATVKRGRGRPKSLSPEEIVRQEDDGGGVDIEGEELEMTGALETADTNAIYPPSEYSTIQSTISREGTEPDITIARFDPGNETPRRTGWSSPRIFDGPSSTARTHNTDSVPVSSPQHTLTGHDRAPSPAPSAGYLEDNPGDELDEIEFVGQQYEEDDQEMVEEDFDDQTHGYRHLDNDTVLNGEDFSMISIDSIPSLRDHLSSPVNQNPGKESMGPVRNKALSAVQEAEAPGHDSFSSIADAVLKAATPGRKPQNPKLLSVQNSRMDDSFSSIPPDILEAATPARKTAVSRLLANHSRLEDSFSSIAPEILEAATPGRVPQPKVLQQRTIGTSQKSPSVAASITPAFVRHASSKPPSPELSGGHIDDMDPTDSSHEAPSANNIEAPNTIGGRLPTPDETPSPPREESSLEGSVRITQVIGPSARDMPAVQKSMHTAFNESSILSNVRSSPPSAARRRYTYTAHLRQRREFNPNETETPSIVFSSPTLPPIKQFGPGHPLLQPKLASEDRPQLSPIMRTGQLLQDLVVPLSSPRSRAQSLGSPFKSPSAERRLSAKAESEPLPSPTQERRQKPFPRLDMNGNLLPGPLRRGRWTHQVPQDDPFSNQATTQQRSSPPGRKEPIDSEQNKPFDSRLSTIMSEGNSKGSFDEMSWQAEEEIRVNDSTNSSGKPANSLTKVIGSSFDHGRSEREQEYATERANVSHQIRSADPDNVVDINSGDDESDREVNDEDDYGLLLETLNSSSPAEQPRVPQPLGSNIEKPRRSKIPSPWRQNSKRLVYSDEISHLPSAPSKAPLSMEKQPIIESMESDDFEADLSEFIIPQKANFKPRPRESGKLDLATLLGSSPDKSLFPATGRSKKDGFTSNIQERSATVRRIDDVFTAPQSQAQGFTPIPQKMGFQPRPRAVSNPGSSPLKNSLTAKPTSLFTAASQCSDQPTPEIASSSSQVQPLGDSSPSRSNTLQRQQTGSEEPPSPTNNHSENSSSFSSSEHNYNDVQTQLWAETVSQAATRLHTPDPASPTKSCLRSPLKTPMTAPSPGKNVAFVSSSPLPASPILLSSTEWTNQHWMLLKAILQAWRPENKESADGEKRARRSSSSRVISKLLGKYVKIEGEDGTERMKLEQWHLEVVDEFRGQVAGWQEAVVAKYVFGLLLGEKKRRAGVVGDSGRKLV